MRRVAEIIYVVPEQREEYLAFHLNPTKDVQQILWMHGVRNQFYFDINGLILLTFEYVGKDFYKDMEKLAAYPDMKAHLISKRRRDVPVEERETTNWWAPIKKLGSILEESPMPDDEEEEFSLEEHYRTMINGQMMESAAKNDISFDEDDWSESIHI